MRGVGRKRTGKWWTREKVLAGLKRFHEDFGFCPTSSEKYAAKAQGTGIDPRTGGHTNLGWYQLYPSFATILNFFGSFRQAWTAAGFEVDQAWEEWSPEEDWYVLESVGIIPRVEVAAFLRRSGPAVKRRLYDLGDIRSYNRWGITLTHAEKLMGLSSQVIKKYLIYGIIPYLKGNKLYYLNPADLLKVEEVDWSKPVDPELDALIRNAIVHRIAKMAKYGDKWRDTEVYTFQKTKERYSGRIKNPRKSAFLKVLPEMPNDLEVGDWVTATKPLKSMLHGAGKRIGIIKALLYSPQAVNRLDKTKRACWIARVEFPKIRTITNEKDRRIKWTIPLDCLERAEKPEPEPKPLSMHPEAIRGRQRFADGLVRARKQFEIVRGDLT